MTLFLQGNLPPFKQKVPTPNNCFVVSSFVLHLFYSFPGTLGYFVQTVNLRVIILSGFCHRNSIKEDYEHSCRPVSFTVANETQATH